MSVPRKCDKCELVDFQDCNASQTGYIPGPECPFVQIRELEKEQVTHIGIIEDNYEKELDQLRTKVADLTNDIQSRDFTIAQLRTELAEERKRVVESATYKGLRANYCKALDVNDELRAEVATMKKENSKLSVAIRTHRDDKYRGDHEYGAGVDRVLYAALSPEDTEQETERETPGKDLHAARVRKAEQLYSTVKSRGMQTETDIPDWSIEEAEAAERDCRDDTDTPEQEVQGETVATGTIVLATLQHWYTKNTRYAVLKKVDLDDEVYRIAYEDAQLSDDWNVVDVRVLTTKPGEG